MEKTVFFRAFEEEDIDAIYQWKNDDELNKLTVGLNRKVCRDDVAKWVRSKMPHNPYEVFCMTRTCPLSYPVIKSKNNSQPSYATLDNQNNFVGAPLRIVATPLRIVATPLRIVV